jgi:asparagine synthase (glutamine-hydrolysing)
MRGGVPLRFDAVFRCAVAGATARSEHVAWADEPALRSHRDGRREVRWVGRPRLLDADRAGPAQLATGADLLSAGGRLAEGVLAHLDGPFLIAWWDDDARAGLVAVDRFSTYPLFWTRTPAVVAIGTAPAAVLRAAGMPTDLDLQSVLAYAYFHMVPAPRSIFRGAARLEHGHALRVSGSDAQPVRYWSPAFDEDRRYEFDAEKAAFFAALRTGLAHATEGLPREEVGCFLSGGTDSSTLAGLVTEHFGGAARTFSIGFDVDAYDESRYSRLAAQHFGTEHVQYVLTPADALAGTRIIAATYEQPFGNASAVPTYQCARLAREAGVRRMLGGDGGDELYGGNERYAKQAVFARYARVPQVLRAALIEPLLFGPLRASRADVFAKGRSYVEQARQPLPDRMQGRYNLLNWLGCDTVFTRDFLGEVDSGDALAQERDVWSRCEARSQINRLLAYDFKFTLADNDLPKVTRMCHAAGVDVAFPMLDGAVVGHSLGLSPGRKLRGTELRHFFRAALRGFLPDAIIDKSKHGFGMPFGDWLMANAQLRAQADDALSGLSGRRIVRAEFIDALRARLRTGNAGYYGTMVWVLMMLELWLRESPAADMRL